MKYHIRFIHFIAILTAILVPVFVQAVEPDSYEEDDTAAQAKIIILNDAESQKRSFHETGDEDWIKFYGLAEEKYSVQAENVGADCDVVIRLYDTDGVTFLEKGDDGGKGMADSLKSSPLSRDGIYYVKIHNISEIFGENTQYDLRIFLTDASAPCRCPLQRHDGRRPFQIAPGKCDDQNRSELYRTERSGELHHVSSDKPEYNSLYADRQTFRISGIHEIRIHNRYGFQDDCKQQRKERNCKQQRKERRDRDCRMGRSYRNGPERRHQRRRED